MHAHPGMDILSKSLTTENRIKILLSLSLVILGLYLIGTAILIYIIVGVLLIVPGMYFLIPAILEFQIHRNPMMNVLIEDPQTIVWVYSVVTERMPFGLKVFSQSTLYFKLLDKEEHSVSIPEKYIDIVTRMLNKKLPHATFGFSRDKEQWYIASPELLIKDEKST